MVLSHIRLKNFRKHSDSYIKFSNGLNYIIGGNGQGKTSVLEAIYYLCTTKNFGSADSSILKFKEKEFEVTGSLKGHVEDTARVIFVGAENKKYYLLNGKNITRSADIIGKFPVVLLAPGDHSITQGGPSERRKFIDSVLSQASETYLSDLLEYNKTLRQRGYLLGKIKETRRNDYLDELEAWSSTLVTFGTSLINKRESFIKEFKSFVTGSYKRIMNDLEIPGIKYQCLDGYEGSEKKNQFENLLIIRKEEEIRRGINLVGPHRDDFLFEIDGMNLKTFGSQGQHKTFQVALRFAEFFYLKEVSGKTPLFMLDDVFGELDVSRSEKISGYLRDVGQAFVTLTDFTDLKFIHQNETDNLIRLKEGAPAYV